MTISRTSTFRQTPPRRPGEGDVLAGTKENATPTVPPHMLSAEEFEQMARLVVALGTMVPLIRISIGFDGSTPLLDSFMTVREDIIAGDFTLVDHAAGDTEIRFLASKFPALRSRPMVSLNSEEPLDYHFAPNAELTSPSSGVTGVRVRTRSNAGTLVDTPYTVEIS